jgi:ribosomal protein L11 methyltransferase
MLRLAMIVRADAVEDVLDELVPLLPAGVHERDLGSERVELAFYVAPGDRPAPEELEAAAGGALIEWAQEEEAPDDPRERRKRFGRTWEIDGRMLVRSPDDPPGDKGLPEVVIEPIAGAFGTGAHPTTRMCLQILLDMEPGGAFADLGCGAGVLAVTAAAMGWEPVFAVDHEPRSVEATRRNARRNGVAIEAVELDLTQVPPPPAPTIAANVPLAIHAHIAPKLESAVVHVIVSGIVAPEGDPARELYERAGFKQLERLGGAGWQALLMERA